MNKSLTRLVLDTSTKFLYIALLKGEEELDVYYQEGNNDHSVKLMVEIERLFLEHNLQVSDLDEIIVGIGPGSYTGLRIGLAVAKMFAWNNDIPIQTVSSLALIASAYEGSEFILAEMDARRGNSFLGLYQNTGKSLRLVEKEQLTNLKNFQESVDDSFATISFGQPNIVKILHSDLLKRIEDIHGLHPNYLRQTEAERNLKNS